MPPPPRNERIAVIGAGPPASPMRRQAEGNAVTVFEKDAHPGGSFRYAGKAPLFQEVEASEMSFERRVADLGGGLRRQGGELRFNRPPRRRRNCRPVRSDVVATGAAYRFGPGPGRQDRAHRAGHWALLAVVFCAGISRPILLLGRCEPPTAFGRWPSLDRRSVIGDAVSAGEQAGDRQRAFDAALLRQT